MSAHIPGPWAVCVDAPNPQWQAGLTIGAANPSDARRVCDVHDWGIDFPVGTIQHDMTAANARLIAAAPDLLDVVTALFAAIENYSITNTTDEDAVGVLLESAQSAIAKATQP